MKIVAVIPARYASTRLPGKPLQMIGGQSLIQRVYAQVRLCPQLDEVWVATDDPRIYQHVQSWGGEVVMTAATHVSGTDRCLEALQIKKSNHNLVLNIQGDEPFLDPDMILQLIALFHDNACSIGTLVRKIEMTDDLFNPSCVKAVLDKNQYALYFSRNPSPYLQHHEKKDWIQHHTFYAHLGLYGFRVTTLQQVCALPPSPLEIAESLEQLRWMENGFSIKTALTRYSGFGIDTPEDLERARKIIS